MLAWLPRKVDIACKAIASSEVPENFKFYCVFVYLFLQGVQVHLVKKDPGTFGGFCLLLEL